MSKLKILIVENELLVAEEMAARLQKLGYEIADIVSSGAEAINKSQQQEPDIILMDIHIDGPLDGIDTAIQLNAQGHYMIIYLTDYDDSETIKRASATNPANYLLKPFNERQLKISIEMALSNTSKGKQAQLQEKAQEQDYYILKDRIFVKQEQAYRKVKIEDILFLEAERAYCHMQTEKERYTFSTSMGNLFQQIPAGTLMQVHRSHVVNPEKIDAISGNELSIGNFKITMSETYREAVLKGFALVGSQKPSEG